MRIIASWTVVILAALSPLAAQVNFSPTNCGTQGLSADVCSFTPSGGTAPYTFSYTVDNPGAPGTAKPKIPGFRVLNAPDVPSFANPNQTGALGGLPLTTGVFTTTIRCTDKNGNFRDQDVTFTVPSLDVGGNPPFLYGIGDTVSYQFQGIGGTTPYHFALGGTLPDGLALDPTTGIVSGTILNTANNNSHTTTTAASNGFGFNITITDSANNTAMQRFYGMSFSAFQVLLGGVPVNTGSNRLLPNGTFNQQYSEQLTVNPGTSAQGPFTFSLGTGSFLPGGLTLSSSGLISGTATQSGFDFAFTIHVQDSATPAHTTDLRFGMHVLQNTPSPLTIGTSTLNDAGLGDNTSLYFSAFGGLPPYHFSFADRGNLTADAEMVDGWTNGPNWDPFSGSLRARIHTLGTYNFTVQVTDAGGNTATRPFTWNIRPLTFFNQFPANAVVGTPYQFPMLALGGSGSYIVTLVNVPAGLSMDGNGLLLGTPLENGNFLPLFINVTDSSDATKTYTSNGNISIFSPTAVSLTCTGGNFTATRGAQFAVNLNCGQSPTNVFTSVTITSGSPPPGLQLLTGNDFNNNGNTSFAAQLAGVPTTVGDSDFIYMVVDSAGNQGSRHIHIHVSGLVFATLNLAPGTVNVPYSQTLDVRGGALPYSFTISTGNLPSGLNIDPATGTIFGTPTTEAATSVGVTVTDKTGDTFTRFYNLSIYPLAIADPVPATPNVLPLAFAGEPYSVNLQTSIPGTYQWTINTNISWLSLNPSTGVLSGTPSSIGTFTFSVTAANASNQVVSKFFTLFNTSRQNLPVITGLPRTVITGLPGTLLATLLVGSPGAIVVSPAGGTPPYTISVSSGSLPPGLQLVQSLGAIYDGTIDAEIPAIVGVATTVGTYAFTLHYVDSAGLAEDRPTNINVTPLSLATTSPHIGLVNQPYSAHLYGLGGNGTYTFAVTNLLGNTMPPGLNLNPDGSITGIPTSTSTGWPTTIDLTSGVLTRRIGLNFVINATNDNRQVGISTSTLTGVSDGQVGREDYIAFSPTSGAAPYNWTFVSGSLPPGMPLLSGATLPPDFTGQPFSVSDGSPTAAGTYPFRVRVDDSSGTFGIQDASVTISPLHPLPLSTYNYAFFLPPGQVGTPYSFQWNMADGRAPFTFTQLPGTLLPGAVTMSTAGLLSGTPATAGNFPLNLLVKDANGTTETISQLWLVYAGKIGLSVITGLIDNVNLASASIGSPYTVSLNDLLVPNYGTAPFSWTLFSGSLPNGLVITPGGGTVSDAITGTPTGPAATSNFSLLVTDAKNSQAVVALTIIASGIGITPAQGPLPPAVLGTPYSQQLTASGGIGPYTYSASWFSDLAGGLNISPTGLLSGTPTVYGQFVVWVDVTDSTGALFRARYPLTVSATGTTIPAFNITPKSVNVPYVTGDPSPAPIPLSIAATPSSSILSFTVVASGGSWLSISPGAGTTPSSPTITINPAGLVPNTYNGAITATSAAASNSPFVIPVVLTVTAPVACSYSVVPPSGSLQSAATSSSFGVVTNDPSCQWTAGTTTPWITLNNTSGTGNANVNFSVSDNSAAGSPTRNGSVSVQGISYNLTQFGSSCDFSLNPSTLNIPAAGGSGQITVNASSSTCQWNPPPVPPSGITLQVVDTNTGTGHLNVTVAQNLAPSTLTNIIAISNRNLTVNQAGANCTYSLTPGSGSVPSTGGLLSFTITAPSGCASTVDTGPSWITLVSNVNGAVTLKVSANTTVSARSANVLVAGSIFQVTQAGQPCSFSLSVNNPVQPATGGNGAAGIAATGGPGCGWTASTDAPWISLSTNTGTDTGSVTFHAASNANAAARSANVTVAGQNILVTQSGTLCTFSLRSPSATMPATGGSSAVGVLTATGCSWSAPAGLPSWLHATSAASVNGPGDFTFTADPNSSGSTRSAAFPVAGSNYAVTQPAETCAVTLVTSSSNSGQFGGPGQFSYNASCSVTIQSYTSWITITNTATPGLVEYSVSANAYAAPRSGTIVVNDQTFTVTQDASTCAYDLSAGGANGFLGNFSQSGGNGSILMNFMPAQCGAPPILVNAPPGMITLGTVNNTSTTYTENYNVSLYLSFINYVRTAQLSVSGQIYTVKQTSW